MSTNEDRQTHLEESAKSALNFMTKYKTKSKPKTLTEASEKPSDINDLVTSIIDETGDDVELNEDAKVEDETPVVADAVVEPIVEDNSEPVVEDVVAEPVVTDPVVSEPVVEDSDEPVTEVTEVTDVTDVVSEDIAFNDHELEVFNMLMQEIKESDEVDEDDPIVQEDAVDELDLDLDLDLDLEESFNNILDDEDEDVDDSEDFDLDLDLNF